MRRVRTIFVMLLFLSISLCFKLWLMQLEQPKQGGAERLRSFVSALIWQRADRLMHLGAMDLENQRFKAGSYVGNTDIIPMLKLVTDISPEELAPYQLLARSLAYAHGNIDEGLRVLQACAMRNPHKRGIHEIYASMAFLRLFMQKEVSQRDRGAALGYLRRARTLLRRDETWVPTDPAYTAENYSILIAAQFVELGLPERALEELEVEGIGLAGSADLIFAYLAEYKNTGIDKDSFLRSQEQAWMGGLEGDGVGVAKGHESLGEEKAHSHNKATYPTLKYFFAILRSGLLFMLLLVFSKSNCRIELSKG